MMFCLTHNHTLLSVCAQCETAHIRAMKLHLFCQTMVRILIPRLTELLSANESSLNSKHKCKGKTGKSKIVDKQFSPWVLDRLIPVNCQDVTDSGKKSRFTDDVNTLKIRKVSFSGKIAFRPILEVSWLIVHHFLLLFLPIRISLRTSTQPDVIQKPAFRKPYASNNFIVVHVFVIFFTCGHHQKRLPFFRIFK